MLLSECSEGTVQIPIIARCTLTYSLTLASPSPGNHAKPGCQHTACYCLITAQRTGGSGYILNPKVTGFFFYICKLHYFGISAFIDRTVCPTENKYERGADMRQRAWAGFEPLQEGLALYGTGLRPLSHQNTLVTWL